MLFSSFEFIFAFLPIVLLGWDLCCRTGKRAVALHWLLASSLFFYAWWNPSYLGLMLATMVINYGFCRWMEASAPEKRRRVLWLAVALNLGNIGFFKYAGFICENLAAMGLPAPTGWDVVLPLGISFYTFQQLAFVVDVYRGYPAEKRLGIFALVVTIFPHLIAGPIVHPRKFIPQFTSNPLKGLAWDQLAPGITLFILGLFKKVVIADQVAKWSSPAFDAAPTAVLTFLDAWTAAIAYSFQIYFDFSGYSDMAIGLGLMFGLNIPLNFNSPYKAVSLIDFWRRWHITLSELLRDYVYIPLGGNRKGKVRRHVNLMLTMLIGGLWHGAGWTYVIWGGLHGLCLVVNHLWSDFWAKSSPDHRSQRWRRECSWLATLLVVVLAWVCFRAPNFDRAEEMLKAMFGFQGLALPPSYVGALGSLGLKGILPGVEERSDWIVFGGVGQLAVLLGLLAIVRAMPNTQEIMGIAPQAGAPSFAWRPSRGWAFVIAVAFVTSILHLSGVSEFLYFQF